MSKTDFDFNKALEQLQAGQGLTGKDGVLTPLIKQLTEAALEALEAKWGAQYPLVISSWQRKWENLSVYFKYPEYIRKVMYTTNAIEAVLRQFRKLTKTKGGQMKIAC